MDELERLVRLVKKYNTKSSPLINFQDDKNLDARLFDLLKSGKVSSDEQVAQLLYGNEKLSVNYRMLKSRVRKKLINHIHFLELPENKFSAINVVKSKCASMLFEAERLKTMSEPRMAGKILDQALSLAKKNEVNDYIVILLEQKQWVNQMLFDEKKYDQQAKELACYYELEAAERKASIIFQKLLIVVKTKFDQRSQMLSQFPNELHKLKLLWKKSKSSKIYFYYHFLNIQFQEQQGNYHLILDLISEAENLLNRKKVHPNWFNYRFNSYMRVYALLQTGQHEIGLKQSKEYIGYFETGSLNWFAFMENYLMLAVHSQKYDQFKSLYQTVVSTDSITRLPRAQQERWELNERYFSLLFHYRLGGAKRTSVLTTDYPSLTIPAKEKDGLNVGIIIIETIDMLSDASIDDYEAQVERLKKYIQKHLRGDKAVRARLFLRLLILVFREEFNLKSIKEKGDSMLLKLTRTPFPGDAFAEVEIIPYEHLWEIVLEVVEQRQALLH
ncbi:hypothetical protein ACSX1A_03755 [Pontibacter sp. MBLB2868]|uniref:hypothetical protein n=1 Tax=Pontibacter sp. MBLB2868 TaxID=3451555 RepID=UPI003F7551CB